MTDKTSSPIQVALASYGMSGSIFHAPLISSNLGFQITKILERSADTALQRYPEVTIAKKYEELILDDNIELIIVNTPNAHHLSMAEQALEAGKHVVIEKPFTITSKDAQSLIDTAKKNNRILSVFQNRRWDGDFLTVQQVVKQGLLGKLVDYEAHYDRYRNYIEPNTWKEAADQGAGILYNLGSHMIDQALVLFGKPTSVTAEIGINRPGGRVDDYYLIIMHYPALRVTLKSSYLVREEGPRYTLHGTEGSFLKFGIDPQETDLKAGKSPAGPDWGKEEKSTWGILNTQVNGLHFMGHIETLPGNYNLYYESIYGAIREGKALQVQPEEAMLGIEIIEAALKSNAEKRTIEL